MDEIHVRRFMHVEAADGPVGYVEQVVVDPHSGRATDLVIAGKGRRWLVPVSAISAAADGGLTLRGAWARYREAGTLPSAALRPLEPAGAPEGDGRERLTLLEERFGVSKAREQAGLVRIGKRVLEHTESVTVPLREDRLVVQHRPGSGGVTIGDRELHEGDSVELPLMRERVDLIKEPVIVEEVTVRKEILQRAQQVRQSLRREELHVDDPAGIAHQPAQRKQPPIEAGDGVQR